MEDNLPLPEKKPLYKRPVPQAIIGFLLFVLLVRGLNTYYENGDLQNKQDLLEENDSIQRRNDSIQLRNDSLERRNDSLERRANSLNKAVGEESQ